MKNIAFATLAAFSFAAYTLNSFGQPTESRTDRLSATAPYIVTERGPHHRVWAKVVWETNTLGWAEARTNSYIELATGLHYPDANGVWTESREEIEMLPRGAGAVARHGQHEVIFPADIHDGAIQMRLPDGQLLRSRVLGLSYYDTATSNSVLIAETTNSVGEIHGSNVVIYPAAFTDFRASIRLTYTRAGFEQDIILLEQPPSPKEWDMNPETTRLQVLTEFFDPPQPSKRLLWLRDSKGDESITDELLDFGTLQMPLGKAFSLDRTNSDAQIPVAKTWQKMSGRDFLVEEVEVNAIAKDLEDLPKARGASLNSITNAARHASSGRMPVPVRRQASNIRGEAMRIASNGQSSKGFVLDYTTINTSQANYTFKGDTTYYISAPVTLSGTTTFEGGAVIKYAVNAKLTFAAGAPIVSKGSAYRPVIFTAKDDHTVGEPIGSAALSGYYAYPALSLIGYNGNLSLSGFRISHAKEAINGNYLGLTLTHGQIVNCENGILVGMEFGPSILRNVLFAKWASGAAAMRLSYANAIAEHCTFDAIPQGPPNYIPSFLLLPNGGPPSAMSFKLTNCILANVSYYSTAYPPAMSGDHNGFFNSATPTFGSNPHVLPAGSPSPFQTVGAANYYLTTNPNGTDASGFRNLGLGAINASLADDLKSRTTHPPLAYTGTSGTLAARNIRDTDTPDLGYHYTPLDYTISGINGSFTLTNGVAIGIRGASGFYGGTVLSIGTPKSRNQFTVYTSVQEQSMAWGGNVSSTYLFNSWSSGTQFRFTDISLAGSAGFSPSASANLSVMDCLLHATKLSYSSGNYGTLRFTNNIFDRCYVQFLSCGGSYYGEFYNNLFLSSANFGIGHACSPFAANFTLRNNLFVNSSYTYGAGSPPVAANNGFFNTPNQGTSPVSISAPLDFDDGPLGPYYYPTTGEHLSRLINAGTGTAVQAGLYHHTVVDSPGSKDSAAVDIGFHYMATDANDNVLDSDGDGVPDYVEDKNANGNNDSGETSFANPVITLPGGPLNYTENQTAQPLDTAATVTDADSLNFAGGRLTVDILTEDILANIHSEDLLEIAAGNGISISGNSISFNGQTIGTFSGGTQVTPLVINFTTAYANQNAVGALVRQLTFRNTSDQPAPAARTVRLVLTDGDGGTSSPATKTVNVSSVNDIPAITLSATQPIYTPGGPAILVDSEATVFDQDSFDFNGGALTVSITANAHANDLLEVRPHGDIGVFTETGTLAKKATYRGIQIGTISGGSYTTPLSISFNAQASLAAVDALIRSISYRNTSATPPSDPRTIRFQVTDGDTGTSLPQDKGLTHTCTAMPLDVMLVIDRSGSMNGTKFDVAKAGAKKFIDSLDPSLDQVGVVFFQGITDADAVSPGFDVPYQTPSVNQFNHHLSNQGTAVKTMIDAITTGSGTRIDMGIRRAQNELEPGPTPPAGPRRRANAYPLMIVLTDGNNSDGYPDTLITAAANAAKGSGTHIITIGLGADVDDALLQAVADSPSDYHFADDSDDIEAIYTGIAASLCRDNRAPVVNAGPDGCGELPASPPVTVSVTLTGSATDNPGQTLTYRWSLVSGPASASVSFANPASPMTTATFSIGGIYRLRLTVSDGSLSASDDVEVLIFPNNPSPDVIVDAGLPQSIIVGMEVQLNGTARNSDCNALNVTWSQASAPDGASVTFCPPGNCSTTTTLNPIVGGFTQPGEYVLRLTSGTVYDDVTVTVCNQHEAPLDIFLIFDESASMTDCVPEAKRAANRFVDLVDLSVHKVALLPFSSFPRLLLPLTQDREVLQRSLNSLQADGGDSDLAAAIRIALQEANQPGRDRGAFPVFVIISDGGVTLEVTTPAADEAKLAGARIITIGPACDPISNPPNTPYLETIASSPQDCHIVAPDELTPLFESIVSSFCSNPNRRPVVFAGPDRKVDTTRPIRLSAGVYDENASSLTLQWEVISGLPVNVIPQFTPTGNPSEWTLTFNPAGKYDGPIVLELTATEPSPTLLWSSDEVTLWHGQSSAPQAVDDARNVPTYNAGEIPQSILIDVLRNDLDADGDGIAINQIMFPSIYGPFHGKAEVVGNRRMLRYTPNPGAGGIQDTIRYQITDGKDGMTAISEANVNLYLQPLNKPPVANNDVFEVLSWNQGGREIFLDVLWNDSDPDPIVSGGANHFYPDPTTFLRIVSITPPPPGQGTLRSEDLGAGNIAYYYVPPSSPGTSLPNPVVLNYSMADQLGALASGTVTIHVVDTYHNNQPPTVVLGPPIVVDSFYPASTMVALNAIVTDDGLPNGVRYDYTWSAVGQQPGNCEFDFRTRYGLWDDPSTLISLTGDGVYTVQLEIQEMDAGGNPIGAPVAAQKVITVAPNGLIASIDNVPDDAIVNDGFLHVKGAADDSQPTTPDFSYVLRVLNESGTTTLVQTPASSTPVLRTDPPGDFAHALDLSMLPNDRYTLELEVKRTPTGPTKTVRRAFQLNSQLKLGRFTFSQEDVVIPTGGLPLTVVRTYDSFKASKLGDFGYGWTFALKDLDVQLDETRATVTDEGQPVSVRTGGRRDVTLTLPDGQRVTYLYTERLGGFSMYYYAEFIKPPGVFAELTPMGDNRLSGFGVVTWQNGGFNTPYEAYDFPGFYLTMPDQTKYEIQREPLGSHFFAGEPEQEIDDGSYVVAYGTPKLASITSPNQEKIVFGNDSIEHYDISSPVTPTHRITFKRDTSGRITEIVDPNTANGIYPVVKYVYDQNGDVGDLSEVHRLTRFDSAGAPVYEIVRYAYAETTPSGTPPAHYLTSIKDPRNLSIPTARTEYDNNNRIKKIVQMVSATKERPTTYAYGTVPDGQGRRIQTVTDYLNNSTQQLFDSRGNVVETRDPENHSVTREYDDFNNVTSIAKQGQASPVTYTYDYSGLPASETTFFTVNGGANTEITTKTYYNGNGQITGITDPRTYAADPSHSTLSTINDYNGLGSQLSETTDALGKKTTYSYFDSGPNYGRLQKVTDALNNTTEYDYDARGNATSITAKNSSGQALSFTTYTYDANNNRLSESRLRTLPTGVVESINTTNRYDLQNRLIETIDALGQSTKTVYNSIGKVDTSIDKLGRQTTYLYDSTGDLVKTTYPDGTIAQRATYTVEHPNVPDVDQRIDVVEDPHFPGSPAAQVMATRTIYDQLGRPAQTDRLSGVVINISTANGIVISSLQLDPYPTVEPDSTTTTTYDTAGRAFQTTDARNNITQYGYDEAGHRITVTRGSEIEISTYDENANLKSTYIQGPQNLSEVKYEYDALNRRVKVIHPDVNGVHDTDPNERLTEYDDLGRVSSETDAAGVRTEFGYDGLGRLASVRSAAGTDDETLTAYVCDEVGNQTKQVDALLRETRYEYDALGQRTRRILPGGTLFESFTYNEVGNMLSRRDFNGRTTTFQYDVMNRLYKKIPDSYFGAGDITYTYTATGKRNTVTDTRSSPNRVTTYTYDTRDRLQRKVSPEGVLKYTYDGNGNVLTVKSFANAGTFDTPYGGLDLTYEWDSFNRLDKVTDEVTDQTTDYDYYESRLLKECVYPTTTPVKHTYDYNEANWLTNVLIESGSTALKNFGYSFAGSAYGRSGARLGLNEDDGGRVVSYAYDPLYRLNSESISGTAPVGTITYDSTPGYDGTGFDKVGNRRSRDSTVAGIGQPMQGYSYNDLDRLAGDTYDNNGNTTVSDGFAYTYDFENHLKGRTKTGTETLIYTNDHDGIRVSKTVNGVTTYFLVDDQNPTGYPQVVEELSDVDATPEPTKVYTYGLRLVSQRPKNGTPATVKWYAHDGHGSVRALLNNDGTVAQTYTYDAFGILISPTPPTGNDYLYAGEQYDPHLGMYYLRARCYHPDKGRFWSMDSFEGTSRDPLSLHKYLYCHANPINSIDPSGHFFSTITTLVSTLSNMKCETKNLARIETQRKQASTSLQVAMLLVTMNIILSYEYGAFDSADQMDIIKQQTQRRVNPTGSSHAYEYEECVEFADDAMAFFTKQKMNPKRIIYRSYNGKTVGDNISAVEGFGFFGFKFNKNVSTSGMHQGVLVDGAVFDNNVPFGVPRDMWENGYEVRIIGTTRDVTLQQADAMMIGKISVGEDK